MLQRYRAGRRWSWDWSEPLNRAVLLDGGLILCLILVLLVSVGRGAADHFSLFLLISLSILGVVPVLGSALRALRERRVTVDLLASVALAFTFLEGQWYAAAFINLMLAAARVFDHLTAARTKRIINQLLKLRPERVKLRRGEKIIEVPLELVRVGELVVIEAGDRVPVDGVVVSGQASLDQASLTGESEPVVKHPGDPVFSSTLSVAGSLVVRVERVGADTTLAKIIALIDEASRAKTKTERLADRFSAWYIGSILALAALIYLLTGQLSLVLAVLLVTCADDLAVAIPLGYTVAIAKAARHGIIIKGAAALERLPAVKVFVTDKTGTLTRGRPKVLETVLVNGVDEERFLSVLGLCASSSRHPSSQAIVDYLRARHQALLAPDEAVEQPGDGIRVDKDGHRFWVGKELFLSQNGVRISQAQHRAIAAWEAEGVSVTVIAADQTLVGLVVMADELRRFARESVAETRQLGVRRWVLLTGDSAAAAERVAQAVGVDQTVSGLKPEDKLNAIRELKREYGTIAMMGDGVNDAAALALADVSIAMGAIGSDAALATADIALMHDDLRRVPEAILLGQQTQRIVRQNFLIWGLTNVVGLGLVFGGWLGPVGAAVYNFVTDFLPIINVFQIYYLVINRHTYEQLASDVTNQDHRSRRLGASAVGPTEALGSER